MRALDVALQGLRAVARHPERSLLTAATSAVAIAVTVNVISLVYGLDADLRHDTGRFGRRTVDLIRLPVIAAGLTREPLGEEQRRFVASRVADLGAEVLPRRLAPGRVDGPEGEVSVGLAAVPAGYLDTLDVAIRAGRWLRPGDPPQDACVLDESVAALVFPGVAAQDVVGRAVEVTGPHGKRRRDVVGVLSDPLTHRALVEDFDEGQGARALTSALLSFRNVYVPEGALGEGEYSGLSVVARREADVDEIARRLRARWPDAKEDGQYLPRQSVGVFVRRDWMDVIGSSSQTGAFLSNVVWMIIVGVAVVMISTLNLLGIRERYGELAIRRVEGARKSDVALQVTVEGTVLAVAGGLAGLPLGYLGAALLRDVVQFPFRFEFGYAVLATGVSVFLGLLAAALPARQAAALDPVKVLTRRPT